jgi:hypothetical protein
MKTLDQFIEDVRKEVKANFSSYCPQCYSLPAILNSHKCREGWEIWYNSPLEYDVKVKLCVDHINKTSYNRFTAQSIYNSIGVQGTKGPEDSSLRLDTSKPKDSMSEKKEFYLILVYTIIMLMGSIFIAYHSPLDCGQECLESYYE